MFSYKDFLILTDRKDSINAWIDWKIIVCKMNEKEAIKASIDPIWGYKPIS